MTETTIVQRLRYIATTDDAKYSEIAETLTEAADILAALDAQPVPVEPEYLIRLRNALKGFKSDGAFAGDKDIVDYIDSLQSALQVAQQERDIERGRSATRAVEGLAGCFYKPDVENPRWYRPGSLSELRGFYQGALLRMIPAARKCGYALGVHGSMQRDLDLIAAPWVADHADKNELAKQLQLAACGIHADSYQWGAHGEKPCGRVGTVFAICSPEFGKGISSLGCVDLAVMPDTLMAEASNKELRKDAERYRWLRDKGINGPLGSELVVYRGVTSDHSLLPDELDEAIDRARSAK